MNDFDIIRALELDKLNYILDELVTKVLKLEAKVEELEKNPKVVNNYHNTYPQQPQWIQPPPWKYEVTCRSDTSVQ